MPHWHEVAQGETLSFIAYRNGFRSYRVVYDHPENEEFRRKRPNPNVIYPGDRIYIPDPTRKDVGAATGGIHKFVVSTDRKVLRLVVQDFNGTPLRNRPYELKLGSDLLNGETDDRGLLERPIPINTRQGELRVGKYKWKLNIGYLNPVDDTPDMGTSGIQMRLRNLGFDPGPIDGIMGPLTRAAIRGFQKKHQTRELDGTCGPETKARLLQEHGC